MKLYCFLCIILYCRLISAYGTFYIEDDCISQKRTQKVVYNVPATGPNSVGEIRTNRFGTYSRTGRNCIIKLVPPKDHGIMITIKKIDFRNHKPCDDYIQILTSEEASEKLCGYQRNDSIGRSYFSDGKLKIMYHTEDGGYGFNDGIRLIFTVAKNVASDQECSFSSQFKCSNLRCIWAGVLCDGYDNCGDSSDESVTGHSKCGNMTPVTVAVIALTVTTLFAISLAICLCCCRARREPSEKNREWTDFPSRPSGGYIPLPGYTYSGPEPPQPPSNQYPYNSYHLMHPTAPNFKRTSDSGYPQPSALDLPPPYKP